MNKTSFTLQCHTQSRFLEIIFVLTCLSIILFDADSSSVAGQETLVGICGRDFVMLGADSFTSSSISLTSRNVDKIRVLICPFPHKNRSSKNLTFERQQTILASSAGDSADCDRLVGMLSAHASMREFESGIGCDIECVYSGLVEGQSCSLICSSPIGLDVDSVAFLARSEITSSLRSRGRLRACLLIAGMVRSHYSTHSLYGDEEVMLGLYSNDLFLHRIRGQVKATDEQYRLEVKCIDSLSIANQVTVQEINLKSTVNVHGDKKNVLIPKLLWIDEYGSLQALKYGAHGLGANFALSILDQGHNPDMTQEEAADLIKEVFSQLRTRFVVNCLQSPCIKCVDVEGYRVLP